MAHRLPPLYPPTWKEFSRYIRYGRAKGQCECPGGPGYCGLHCTHPGPRRCVERDQQPAIWANGVVVLTVAHCCQCEPLCVIPEHCIACCNRCHLRIDMLLHQHHAAETRRLSKEMLGQIPLRFMT